ncbi:MAG: LytTR family transcriptional regulator [Tenericutes bacterium HGW-Tenericutes-2]|jgi:two-component system response regulator LytT|nr:MAG: LytTR family transcriptional regulator [Tenericutes bacterium HGW-Tenericutes-2]
MKIRLLCGSQNYEKYKEMLIKGGFEITDDANLLFKENDYKQSTVFGIDQDGHSTIIGYNDTILIESFAHKIVLHTMDKEYSIKEKLYEVEGIFEDENIIRINKSQIITKEKIFKIVPQLNSRIKIVLKNKMIVYVTRMYLNSFRNKIGA